MVDEVIVMGDGNGGRCGGNWKAEAVDDEMTLGGGNKG